MPFNFSNSIEVLSLIANSKEKDCSPFWYVFGISIVVKNSLILLFPKPIHFPSSSAKSKLMVSVEIRFSLKEWCRKKIIF